MQYVLWDWNVSSRTFAEKLEAARAGGFDVLTIPYRKVREARAAGEDTGDWRAMADAEGIQLDCLDGMSGWTPIRYAPGDEFMKDALDFSAEEALQLCADFGLRSVVAVGVFAPGEIAIDDLVGYFADFCDLAAGADVRVDLEAMSFGGITSFADAWRIVREADRPNGCLAYDTWHQHRNGDDPALLAEIPPEKIQNVQVVDGTVELETESLFDDITNRGLPGDGELDLKGMLTPVLDRFEVAQIGPEAISAELDALSAAEVGRRARKSMDDVLGTAARPAAG
jgi:sugar phosphate isomerase/epimerase